MRCLDVALNGKQLWRVGVDKAQMYSLILGVSADGEVPADIHISGMCELPDGRNAHVRWGDFYPLEVGDRLTVKLVESGSPTPPTETTAVDDPKQIEEQRLYDEFTETYMGPPESVVARWSGIQIHCAVNGLPRAIAMMSSGEAHILGSVLWNQWHPDRCKVFVRSFGDLNVPETEWLRAEMVTNDHIEFYIRRMQ